MAQTIESFVEKLQTEGVDAGKKAADELLGEARSQADQIIAEANEKAAGIVADAQAEAGRNSERERNDLDLAIRDAVLAFRSRISEAVGALLVHEVGKSLSDTDFLVKLIGDIVASYAHEDARSGEQIRISVNPDATAAITDWALKYLSSDNPEHAHVDLKSTLKTVGFEYRVSESTVEVTLESIVDVLREQVNPQLRDVLDRALAGAAQ